MSVISLTIATRFAHVRRQFGPPGKPETVLAEYPLTHHRLIPLFANTFATAIANLDVSDYWNDNQDKIFEEGNPRLAETHAITSAIKPWASWSA